MQDPTAVDRRRTIALRIFLSAGIGIVVAIIATASAWREFGHDRGLYPEYVATRDVVYELEETIHQYYRNMPPKSLTGLRWVRDMHIDFSWNEAGQPLDGWGRPFVYTVEGKRFTIATLGRDGKPGGVGLDRDLSNTDQRVGAVPATFEQFIFAPLARGAVGSCLLCGAVAFVLSLAIIRPSELQGWSFTLLAIKLLVTAVGAVFVASVLAAVHIPNFH